MIFFFRHRQFFFCVGVCTNNLFISFIFFLLHVLICNFRFYSASLKLKMTHFSFLKL